MARVNHSGARVKASSGANGRTARAASAGNMLGKGSAATASDAAAWACQWPPPGTCGIGAVMLLRARSYASALITETSPECSLRAMLLPVM